MKAVVLAAGSGTRMRPIAFSMAKQLIPVANKPILFYALEDIAMAGISEAVVVIAPDTGREIENAVGDGSRFGLSVEYVVQPEPLGIAHALMMTRQAVGSDDVLLYLGDNMLKSGIGSTVAAFQDELPDCHILLSRVAHPERFGVVTLDEAGKAARLIEKPDTPTSDLALVGVYLFNSSVWDAIESLQPSARGEYEITEAIQWLLEHGKSVAASEVSGWWKDTGRKQDLLEANDLVLADLRSDVRGEVGTSELVAPVVLGAGSRLVNCLVKGPVVVGAGSTIHDSTLRPGTSIGNGCRIAGADIARSVLLDGVQVDNWRLQSSIVGRDANLSGRGPDQAVSVTLGERSEVNAP